MPAESPADFLRRTLSEQMDGALSLLSSPSEHAADERVHETRKHLKRLRSLLSLASAALDPAQRRRTRQAVRQSARSLAEIRSHAALLEAVAKLAERFPQTVDAAFAARLRETLQAHAPEAEHVETALDFASRLLSQARAQVPELKLRGNGWASLAPGFEETFAKARRAYERALAERTPDFFHAFRTPAKRHHHHVELFEPTWPSLLHAHRKALSELGETLGEHHDVTLLLPELAKHEALRAEAQALAPLVSERQSELERHALELATRLFAEKPRAIGRRFGAYYAAFVRKGVSAT